MSSVRISHDSPMVYEWTRYGRSNKSRMVCCFRHTDIFLTHVVTKDITLAHSQPPSVGELVAGFLSAGWLKRATVAATLPSCFCNLKGCKWHLEGFGDGKLKAFPCLVTFCKFNFDIAEALSFRRWGWQSPSSPEARRRVTAMVSSPGFPYSVQSLSLDTVTCHTSSYKLTRLVGVVNFQDFPRKLPVIYRSCLTSWMLESLLECYEFLPRDSVVVFGCINEIEVLSESVVVPQRQSQFQRMVVNSSGWPPSRFMDSMIPSLFCIQFHLHNWNSQSHVWAIPWHSEHCFSRTSCPSIEHRWISSLWLGSKCTRYQYLPRSSTGGINLRRLRCSLVIDCDSFIYTHCYEWCINDSIW